MTDAARDALRAHCSRCDLYVELLSDASVAVAQHALLGLARHQMEPRRRARLFDRIRYVLDMEPPPDPNAHLAGKRIEDGTTTQD